MRKFFLTAPKAPKLVMFPYQGSSQSQIMLSSSSTLKWVVYKLHCLLGFGSYHFSYQEKEWKEKIRQTFKNMT